MVNMDFDNYIWLYRHKDTDKLLYWYDSPVYIGLSPFPEDIGWQCSNTNLREYKYVGYLTKPHKILIKYYNKKRKKG